MNLLSIFYSFEFEQVRVIPNASLGPELRQELSIDDSLVWLSVGIENVDDLIADLATALGPP